MINLNLDRCTSPSITYCIKNITHNGAINYGGWKTVSISHSEYVSNGHYSGKHEFHDVKLDGNKGDQNITIMGTWTSRGTVESCKVKVPEVPEVASDRISEAQAKYLSLLSDVKRRGKFKGKTLLQPEIYIVWIPTEDQFELKVKEVLRPVVVSTDPALILRIGKQYDHVVALWDGPNEIPLEGIIRKYMK